MQPEGPGVPTAVSLLSFIGWRENQLTQQLDEEETLEEDGQRKTARDSISYYHDRVNSYRAIVDLKYG